MTFSPRSTHSTAVSASNTARPTAAPGEALRPLTIFFAPLSAAGSKVSRRSWSTWAGSIRATASSLLIVALVDHVDGDLHGGGRGPLRVARLEHVQPAALDRELEVLDVPVVRLELLADAHELVVRLGHVVLELADLGGGADARDHVLALGVGQVLAEQDALARVGIAGERDAGAGVVAHVPEHHRDDVHGRAEVVGDLLAVAVVVGALAEPRGEHGLDGEVELLVGVGREVGAGVGLDDALELLDEGLEVVDGQVRVLGVVPVALLALLERLVEPRSRSRP